MYCKSCGKQIDDDSNFCMYCGTRVSSKSTENDVVNLPSIFENAVFIDSLFVKQSIAEAKKLYPNITEEEISLLQIISRLIDYTNYDNYRIYYFEIQSDKMRPQINLDSLGKSVLIKNRPVKIELVKAGFLAIEMSEFFIKNESNFNKTVLIADDIIYSDYLCKKGDFENLTIFRRREGESRMR